MGSYTLTPLAPIMVDAQKLREKLGLVDILLYFLNFLALLFLFILHLCSGGDCMKWGFGPCDDDEILHGPALVQATYYVFVYYLIFQILLRSFLSVNEVFMTIWLMFWFFTPVMYAAILGMVYGELSFWVDLGGLAITWVVFLHIAAVAQCAKFWFLIGVIGKTVNQAHQAQAPSYPSFTQSANGMTAPPGGGQPQFAKFNDNQI